MKVTVTAKETMVVTVGVTANGKECEGEGNSESEGGCNDGCNIECNVDVTWM